MFVMLAMSNKTMTSRSARAADTANGSVRSVRLRSSISIAAVATSEIRVISLVLPLATRPVNVGHGALDPLRPTVHVDRVTPVVHPPHTTVAEVRGQVSTPSSVGVETTVLLTPLAYVGALPLSRAALSHKANTHTRDKNVQTIAGDITTVVDDLVEQGVDLAGLGTGELGNVASTFVIPFGTASHGSKSVTKRWIGRVSPRLLTAALELEAATAARRVGIIATRTGHDGSSVSLANSNGVIHWSLVT